MNIFMRPLIAKEYPVMRPDIIGIQAYGLLPSYTTWAAIAD